MPLIYLSEHIPITWRPYFSIQFPAKVITNLPISDRPAEALAILTRENHIEMSMLDILFKNKIINYVFKFNIKGY